MKKLKRILGALFGISSREFSGFKWLVVSILVCVIGLSLTNYLTQDSYANFDEDAAQLDSLLATMEKTEQAKIKTTEIVKLFTFDPNTVGKEELLQLGFPDWLSNQLINYRNKGGKFTKAKDLMKLYNFPDTLYKRLAPFVTISKPVQPDIDKKDKVLSQNLKKKEEKLPPFDLNKVDTSVFQTVKGVGSILSKRIVDYRKRLGGFINEEQLYEIYNLDSAVINQLRETGFIEKDFAPSHVRINEMDEKQLAAHPYISWKQAKLIVSYRNQHGVFTSKEDLLRVYLLNEEWWEKIAPYLSF